MQDSRAVWVRDIDVTITAVLPQGTKAGSCPAVRSGVSWQEGCTGGRFSSGAPKPVLLCQRVALSLQIHIGIFFQWPRSWEKFCFLLKAQCRLKISRVQRSCFLLASQKILVFPGLSWTSLWHPGSDFTEVLRLCFYSTRHLTGDGDVLLPC